MSITQTHIDRLFELLHLLEPLPTLTQDGGLTFEKNPIGDFYLHKTNMTTLDLTLLADLKFIAIVIYNNPYLTSITGPHSESSDGSIDVSYLKFTFCGLTDEGLGNSLRYFNSSSLIRLQLKANSLYGSVDGKDLLPRLGSFSRLVYLDLSYNKFRRIRGGQFKNFTRIKELEFSGNEIWEIGEDAFLFNGTDAGIFILRLDGNRLTAKWIHERNGLDKITSEDKSFNLGRNEIETLTRATFLPMIQPGDDKCDLFDCHTALFLDGNSIVCDEKVKWLKDQKSIYKNIVWRAYCVNDVGKDIFTTSKVQ